MSPRRDRLSLLAVLLALPVLSWAAGGANAAAITWVGDGSANLWDTSSPNWTGGLASAYADGDDVTFGDAGSNSPDVGLTTGGGFGLAPGSVTVNNAAGHDYVFGGAGYLIGSTGITKNGEGTLTIGNANTFTGAVTISGGIVKLNNVAALGSTTGGTTVNGGTTLNPGGTFLLPGNGKTFDEQITVQGVGVNGKGVVVNTVSGTAIVNNLVLAGDATFGGSQRVDFRTNPIFGDYTVTVDHTASTTPNNNGVRITGAGAPDTVALAHDLKDANVVQGLLAFHNATMGQADGTITVTHNPNTANVTTLQIMRTIDYGNNWTLTKNLVFTGGRLHNWRGNYTLAGTITLNANELVSQTEINVEANATYFNALAIDSLITGAGGINKTGVADLTLNAANSYTGNTTISTRKLILGASASIGASPVIDVLGTTSTFDVSAVTGGFTLAGTQTLKGRGTVAGNVLAASGSTIEAGSVIEGTNPGIGSLKFSNSLDLSAGANLVWELGALKDDASGGVAGTDYDQLTVAGLLTLGGTSTLTLDFDAMAEADRPTYATPNTFWGSDHSWKIVDVGTDLGSGTSGTFSALVNASLTVGTFSVSVVENDVLLNFDSDYVPSPPIPGDTDGNRIVNEADAAVLATHWGQTGLAGGYGVGDFNGDLAVNAADASILAANWGNHTGGEGTAGVPEPSMIVLLLGAIGVLLPRRR